MDNDLKIFNLAEQIRNLLEKEESLENRNQQLREQMKNTKSHYWPYFMEHLTFNDVSTVFSMFDMNSLFAFHSKRTILTRILQ